MIFAVIFSESMNLNRFISGLLIGRGFLQPRAVCMRSFMDRQIISFVNGIKKDKKLTSYNEESTRQALIMKLLFLLGWNIFNVDEVKPNNFNSKRQFDYALILNNIKKILIKVKKAGEPLKNCPPQFLISAVKEGAEFFILTNGIEWWLYLVAKNKNHEQNKFCSIAILNQKPDLVSENLVTFLDKENVSEGHALTAARALFKESLQEAFSEAIPEAWRKLVAIPHAELIKLLSEATEKVCGFYPENEAVVKFLTNSLNHRPRVNTTKSMEKLPPPASLQHVSKGKYISSTQKINGQSLTVFSFKGHEYKLKSWSDMLIKICEVLKNKYDQNIENLQWHSVGRKYYFSKNKNDLRFPEKIDGTEIYVETFLTPNEAARAAFSMIQFFGYPRNDFVIAGGKA